MAYLRYMTNTMTADDVVRLFAARHNKPMFYISEKQLRWLAALARDTKTTRRHFHGHNSNTPGTTQSATWTGTFCQTHSTAWVAHEASAGRWITIEQCDCRNIYTETK